MAFSQFRETIEPGAEERVGADDEHADPSLQQSREGLVDFFVAGGIQHQEFEPERTRAGARPRS